MLILASFIQIYKHRLSVHLQILIIEQALLCLVVTWRISFSHVIVALYQYDQEYQRLRHHCPPKYITLMDFWNHLGSWLKLRRTCMHSELANAKESCEYSLEHLVGGIGAVWQRACMSDSCMHLFQLLINN